MANAAALDAHTAAPLGRLACRAGWVVLALAALLSLFPLRFTAESTLVFEVAAQPPAAAVRGVTQLLASRELALDVVARLPQDDVARLAAGAAGDGDARSLKAQAAWRLANAIRVTPEQGGRTLRLAVSAPSPALAATLADATASAFVALDRAVRDTSEAEEFSPSLRTGPKAELPAWPDLPSVQVLVLLALGAAGLAAARLRLAEGHAVPQGRISNDVLPREITDGRRIVWLDAGAEPGLEEEDAVERIGALLKAEPAGCGLVMLTSEDMPEASATCAIALARALAQEAQVALVALDGTAEDLAALISDPWAPGMSELLFGVAGFGETIHLDPRSRAHIIPPGRDARGGPSVVGAERLTLILNALRRTYDYVVVAAPALPAGSSTERLAALDPLLVCIHADTTPATTAVESYDAIAARRFRKVAMACLATEAGRSTDHDAESAALDADVLEAPSLDAAPAPRRALAAA